MVPFGLLVFVGVAVAVVFLILRAARSKAAHRRVQLQHPTEPWMWRHDWADRAVQDEHSVRAGFLWIFGLLWIAMSLPVLFAFRQTHDRDPVILPFLAIFSIVGVIVLIVAAYQSLRRRKYGVSICRIERVPVPIGSVLRCEVQARVHDAPESGFHVRLSSVRRIIRGSGKNRSTHDTVLWQDEQTIGSGAVMPTPDGMRIPIRFAIPADAEPTDESEPRNSVLWRLEVRAAVPGIDYAAQFTLPLFRTNDAPQGDVFAGPSMAAWTPPPNVAFGMSRSGGEEIAVRPVATFGDWFGYLFFIVCWFAVLALIRHFGAPLWIIAFFAVFGTIVLIAAADLLVGRSAVSADRESLSARRSWLGVGKSHRFAANEIESVVARIGTTTGGRARYNVEARFRDGKARIIARHLLSRRDADGVAARVSRALGL